MLGYLASWTVHNSGVDGRGGEFPALHTSRHVLAAGVHVEDCELTDEGDAWMLFGGWASALLGAGVQTSRRKWAISAWTHPARASSFGLSLRGALFPRTRHLRRPARGAHRRALRLHARGLRPLDRWYDLGWPGRTRSHRRRHPRATGGPSVPSGARPDPPADALGGGRGSAGRRRRRVRLLVGRRRSGPGPVPGSGPGPDRARAFRALSAGVPHLVAGPPSAVSALARRPPPLGGAGAGLFFHNTAPAGPASGRPGWL